MNHLSSEKSPYLLQHKENPVDWFPWCDEAFKKAKKEDKPIFLSIGYATCHWCHVMAHESFEDEQVAVLMNEAFINIKVDREERPDIDHTYMTVCQMITGQGGWPLTIVMTPDKEPFYAATYLPKHSRANLPGMLDFVPAISRAWKHDRENVMQSVFEIKNGFAKTLELGKGSGNITTDIVAKGTDELTQRFDAEYGGFGSAPKFPSPHNLIFLINKYRISRNHKVMEMAELTLKKMRFGGIWDHIGFGFHRYSTDRTWLLPHFEKMLYDQALLLRAYTEGWDITQKELFKQTAYEVIQYVEKNLQSKDGAFFSAEDADSEGEEGKFYVWDIDEMAQILGNSEANLFAELYNIHREGNFRDESTRQKTGKNIPHLHESVSEKKKKNVENILKQLRNERENRERPQLDDKILMDWNGLMIASLAHAGRVFDELSLVQKAENAWKFLKEKCFQNGYLLHRVKDDEAAIRGMADDYAFTVWGLLELYQATFNLVFLEDALNIQSVFDREFWDDESGGYYFTAAGAEKLLGRQKEIYDGAVPSSNSVAAKNLYLLSRLTGNPGFEERANRLLQSFAIQIEDAPAGYSFALDSLQLMESDSMEVVLSAPEKSEDVMKMIKITEKHSQPGSVVLLKTNDNKGMLKRLSSFTENYPVGDIPAVYICKNFTCKAPVHSIEELVEALK